MIVLTTNNVLSQTFDCTPRTGIITDLFITDESENVTINVPIISQGAFSYYYQIEAIFNLTENRFYMIELKDVSGNRLLLEKAFCTNQPLATFSVNNGQYVSHTTTNEFIIYE
jgi:hypothetical protein